MSSYRIKLSASKDGAVVFLSPASPDILDVFNAPESSKIADTSKASIPLIRRGARDFADEMGEAMIGMLENFAAATAPANPLLGQLWFQKTPAGNVMRYCMNPNASTEADRWGFVTTTTRASTTSATKITLSGDVNTNLPVIFTANANNEIGLSINLPEVMGTVQNPVDTNTVYTLPQIKVDKKGRIVQITQGAAAATGVPWATATNTQVDVNRNLNTIGKVMEGGNALLPSGSIILWYGATAPLGWKICNGQNGTPDLRDVFVVGSGGAYALNQRGGSANFSGSGTTSSAGAHDHPVSIGSAGAHSHSGATDSTTLTIDQMPNHQHATNWGESNGRPYPQYGALGGQNGPRNNIGSRDTDFDNWNYLSEPVGGGLGHNHVIGSDGAHTHPASATSAGAHTHTMSVSGSTLPPFHALCYIMKA